MLPEGFVICRKKVDVDIKRMCDLTFFFSHGVARLEVVHGSPPKLKDLALSLYWAFLLKEKKIEINIFFTSTTAIMDEQTVFVT